MKVELTMPVLGAIAATRGMLGAGLALLLADRLSASRRKGVGLALAAVGGLATVPLVARVLSHRK